MADVSALQNLDQQFAIVDPKSGRPTDYLMRYLFDRQGYLTEADQEIATLLARQIIAGDGLTGGGKLEDGDVTLNADVQAILDLITTTQGSILYRGSDAWAALAPGTSGQFLKTNGAGANPEWATPAGGGGGAWTVAGTWDHSSDVANVDFTGLGGYSELLVFFDAVRASANGYRAIQFSTDNGSSFYVASGDHREFGSAGTPTSVDRVNVHGTAATTAKTATALINQNLAGQAKFVVLPQLSRTTTFTASTAAINAIRAIPGAGNLTGGSIRVYGR